MPTLKRLLDENPGLANARLGDDDAFWGACHGGQQQAAGSSAEAQV